jgi:protein-L-isoaspartate O-methyltransferase
MSEPSALRKLWARLWLRRSRFGGRYGHLKALYAVEDPWDLGSEREQTRHRLMNDLIRGLAPDCERLLELGSGEGLQTQHLLEVCGEVVGVEISPQAVARARQRCPQATFLVGRAEDLPTILPGQRFDVVTAFEVLYYAREPRPILDGLKTIGSTILVTNYMDVAQHMAGLFEGPGWRRLDDLTVEDTTWRVDVWQAQGAAGET